MKMKMRSSKRSKQKGKFASGWLNYCTYLQNNTLESDGEAGKEKQLGKCKFASGLLNYIPQG